MRDHRSLIAWQRARRFVLGVQRVTTRIWRPALAHFIDQLRRSALSVQLNIAEGHGLATPLLFRRHLTISYGSSIEAVDVLDLLRELVPHEGKDLQELQDWGQECSRLVLGLKHSIESKM
jgi:four helix bundle protein